MQLQFGPRPEKRNVAARVLFGDVEFPDLVIRCDPLELQFSQGAKGPRGPNDQKNLISIEIFNLDRNF